MSIVAKLGAAVLLLVCLACAWAGLRTLTLPRPPLRGELVDIGGRRLRIVCEGPQKNVATPDLPLVVFESGIFGFAADWGEVQKALTAKGVRSCAYDRAGLGFSDPGPSPRDGLAIVGDLEKLLAAKGETGPLVVVGHSMAGLHTRFFTLRNPERVKGLVLVDAASPSASASPIRSQYLTAFNATARVAEIASRFGVMKLLAPYMADSIGLDDPAHSEKVYFWGRASFNHAAAEEVRSALAAAEQARAAGTLDPELPVAVVTEGDPRLGGAWAGARTEAARASRHGSVENLRGASHATMIGRAYASAIVRAVERVMPPRAGEAAGG
jgi:pimeloyl-ACP methyl ester carboxylesterase